MDLYDNSIESEDEDEYGMEEGELDFDDDIGEDGLGPDGLEGMDMYGEEGEVEIMEEGEVDIANEYDDEDTKEGGKKK